MVGGISVWQLLILLLIVVLVFGTKRLRNIGSDLGSAVKGFRKGLEDDENDPAKRERLEADEPDGDDSITRGEPAERKPGSDV